MRFMQKLFSHGVAPDPDREPQIMPMAADESAIEDVVTYMSFPVIFENWRG